MTQPADTRSVAARATPCSCTRASVRGVSRRALLQAAAGVTVGLGAGAFPWRPALAGAHSAAPPVPIPGGSPAIAAMAGELFHVYGPGAEGADATDAEPITITDFDGMIGLAYLNGMVRRTNTTTGEVRDLPFVDSDMRFMKGIYRGTDGQVHHGAFAFI